MLHKQQQQQQQQTMACNILASETCCHLKQLTQRCFSAVFVANLKDSMPLNLTANK